MFGTCQDFGTGLGSVKIYEVSLVSVGISTRIYKLTIDRHSGGIAAQDIVWSMLVDTAAAEIAMNDGDDDGILYAYVYADAYAYVRVHIHPVYK